ncbi:MAG: peptidoglycan LD-endopeptidase LytH, partial [Candidatus Eremiobacteraeota bacterium]|nr:peptidoglycan LD-endopeptidase LytH [Candidatus Eremiobacteraeota bacterium]
MTAADSVPVVVGQARTGIRALAVRGRTYVPARGVFERLGARVSYTPPRLFVRRGDDAIAILHLDTPTAIVYGEPRVLDGPPFVRDRRVYVPLRLVSEILGARVSYASRPRLVRITPGAAPRRPRPARVLLPPADVPRVRPLAAAAPTLRPAPVRRPVPGPRPAPVAARAPRPVMPWWTF